MLVTVEFFFYRKGSQKYEKSQKHDTFLYTV